MLKTYLDADADALDGFEFLTMAEAAEDGHWAVLAEMSRSAGQPAIEQLVSCALPIQQQHFDRALSGSKQLAPGRSERSQRLRRRRPSAHSAISHGEAAVAARSTVLCTRNGDMGARKHHI